MKHWPIILLLIVATGATYWSACRCDFTSWDDPDTISANPRLNPPSPRGVLHYWTHSAGGLYIPVTYTWWSALAAIDPRPSLFHAANVVLHFLSVLLVFSILRRLLQSDVGACIGALLFAVHPMQVESVAWASGAKDVLAGMFSLLMIDQFLRFSLKPHRRGHYAVAMLALLLAILSKPSAVVAPVIAGILAWVRFGLPLKTLLRWLAPMLLLAVACAIGARIAQRQFAPTDTPIWARPLLAADAIAFYLWKLVWPTNLGILYGLTPWKALGGGAPYYSWIIPAAVGIVIWRHRRRHPLRAAGALVFVLALLPTLGFARFEFQIHSTVADHYLYVPMFGVAIALGAMVAMRPSKPVVGLCAAGLVVLSILSMRQLRHWRDSESLYDQALRVNPASIVARDGLARAYASAGRIEEAIEEFRSVVAMAPASRLAHANLAQAFLQAGKYDDAVAQARIALRLAKPGEDVSREQFLLDQALERPSTSRPTTLTAP